MSRRLIYVVSATALLVSQPSWAQQVVGLVTTAPLGGGPQGAPAIGMYGLTGLFIALIGFGVYSVRSRSSRSLITFGLLAGLTLYAGISLAVPTIVLAPPSACDERITTPYDNGGGILMSDCPNPIEITDIQCSDSTAPTPGSGTCSVGQILHDSDSCDLPTCF